MGAASSKRSVMTLHSGSFDIESHRVRIVLAEKGITVNVIEVDRQEGGIDKLTSVNPYKSVPTLVDRDLVLYQAKIIMEYLDERFPHPPLLPVYPIHRAKSRIVMHRIENDWFTLVNKIITGDKESSDKAREELKNSFIELAPVFSESKYFLSDEFSLVDCSLAPILWRLSHFGIILPNSAKAILDYAERIFKRNSFQTSLTESELEIRNPL